MGEHPGQAVAELLRESAAVHVEALQEGVEVLLRAVHAQLGVQVLPDGAVAAELGEVGEQAEELDLVGDHVVARRHELVAGSEVVGDHVAVLARVDVVAHHHRGDVVPAPRGAFAARRRPARTAAGRGPARPRREQRLLGGVLLDGLETHQRGAGLDLAPGQHQELADPRRERRPQHRLHLHALEDQHRGAGRDQVADRDRGGDDQRGCRGAEHAALVAADPVGHAVDLDHVDGPVGGGDQAVALVADGHPGVELVEPLDVGDHDLLDAGRLRRRPGTGAGRSGAP